MKTLYLLRHAKSSWEDFDLNDFDRPLNKRGAKDAPLMGKVMAKKGIKPELIISSTAKRALDTCKAVAKALNYPKEQIILDERLYLATAKTMLQIIHEAKPTCNSLMLVGHNEGITILANELSPQLIDNIVTAGIVSLSFDCDSWQNIKKSNAMLNFFIYPKTVNNEQ